MNYSPSPSPPESSDAGYLRSLDEALAYVTAPIRFDKAAVDAEASALFALGYGGDQIELCPINGDIHAIPLGDWPKETK